MEKHAAKAWVEERFPSTTGNHKAALILAYGAGLDAVDQVDAVDAVDHNQGGAAKWRNHRQNDQN